MAFCNCTINPFIYLVKYRDYQIALKEFCNRNAIKRHGNPYVSHSTDTTSGSTAGDNNEVLQKAP